ncbi:uncharacterized mitochondrial protein AtMg00310-like [Telopea speciosissima]|uniref:uncharacterized mitochondrial protein AtMg00310-like n=1 Tax=Telopea speciosissima TaxID=54955 RepID=UPI001CC7666A|nr:uncharacterized mitochondrial protein AtMg00310-like [Telopea speciosissima]
MSCFRLLASIHKELDGIGRNFYWSAGNKRSIPTMAWSSICEPKQFGGLNIKRSVDMNQALLAKKAWELLISPTSPWGRIMKSKYFPSSNFLDARCPSTSSWGWKSICSARDLIRKGLFIKVGNGQNINPWLDFWIPDHPPSVAPYPLQREAPFSVQDLMDAPTSSGKRDLVFH